MLIKDNPWRTKKPSPYKAQRVLSLFAGDDVGRHWLPKWEIGRLPFHWGVVCASQLALTLVKIVFGFSLRKYLLLISL